MFFLHFVVEAAGEGGIPLRFVFFQIFNFSLFMIALVYLVRKKAPAFLKQKQVDFLEYQNRAKKLEEEHQQACFLLEQEIKTLVRKQERIQEMVKKALEDLKIKWEKQEKQDLDNLRKRLDQQLKRQKIKRMGDLKTKLLSKVMIQAKVYLQDKEKFFDLLGSWEAWKGEGMQKGKGV